jgi:superfamily II DNA or RNA helicase
VKVVEIPTGAGKTWVYALLAKYFCSKGKSVTVIVPNEELRS